MVENFTEHSYKEVFNSNKRQSGNVVKKDSLNEIGSSKIEFHDDYDDGVKVLLKKDEHDQVKEIKFICSCGETKSVVLDYD